MNKKISDSLPEIIRQLQQNRSTEIKAFLGFDACIDNIVRVVKDKKGESDPDYYNDSTEFGEYLISRRNSSCGIELQTYVSKPGGNMVITGNALGNLGIKVDCSGTFGLPDVMPLFRKISSNCTLHTIGETITATALEFKNSKVILFDPGPYKDLTWQSIKSHLETERLIQLLSGKQLVSFLNWSEIENSSQIWQGIIDDILPSVKFSDEQPVFFTDFSDCSRRPKNEIRHATDLLARLRKYYKVIISFNKNEADLVATAMDLSHSSSDENFIKSFYSRLNVDALVIHQTKDALAYDGLNFEQCDTFYCNEPTILTGGGDNFNAGFCFTQLNNFNLFQSLIVANAVAGFYVKTGISPDVDALIEFLEPE